MDQEDTTHRGNSAGAGHGDRPAGISEAIADTMSEAGSFAQRTGEQAKQAFSAAASKATEQAEELADQQLDWGVDMIGSVADSMRAAAEDLSETVPPLGAFAQSAADRIDDLSESLRGQSIRELAEAASDFARRRPAVVLGAAAAVGFLLVRMLSAAPAAGHGSAPDRDTRKPARSRGRAVAGKPRRTTAKAKSRAKRTRSAKAG